ncbi:hypothetical protein CKO44_20135 [Rubrivivax gelatinosus]|uniref:Uncharacterized protein n=1 Tax=Rubrivivax gelatinosus TaxID=28068 RepID=A0ABS1DYP1_RUBGE|nr:hypothetical protein [Rubrivivax gelatinosus]MBK1615770.1 hypothetical protein [Rubrivivax gelatinosus]MBK1714668.1 hypothetical protein [Rubrivivax gelatinosus]
MRTVAPVFASTTPGPLRRLAAQLLAATSRLLAQLACALQSERSFSGGKSVLEFYAEAGAPEGALYLDGELVGRISGVTRL